jgi:hypothetical protein
LSADVRFTENGQVLRVGDGLWRTISELGVYRHYMADPASLQVGFIGTVQELGRGCMLALRLKVAGNVITEIETLVVRDPRGAAWYDQAVSPDPGWYATVPLSERTSRSEVARVANLYFNGLEQNDGRGYYPFTENADRKENGRKVTNLSERTQYGHWDIFDFHNKSAKGQFELGLMQFVTEIRDRRLLVIDEERATVFTFAVLDHNGTVRSEMLTDGRVLDAPPYFFTPRTLPVAEIFKIENGLIRYVEAVMGEWPYGMRPGWEAQADVSQKAFDLRTSVERVLKALVAHDHTHIPLASTAKYTENGQELRFGDGLWRTTSRIERYRIDLADPATGQAGFFGIINESGIPGLLTLRVKTAGQEITEIETIVVRQEKLGGIAGSNTLFSPRPLAEFDAALFGVPEALLMESVPDGERSSRQEMMAAVDRYFDGILQSRGDIVPLSQGCGRRENGVLTANNPDAGPIDPKFPEFRPFSLSCAAQMFSGLHSYVSNVRRRHVLVDEEKGLLLGVYLFDHPGMSTPIEVAGVGQILAPERSTRPLRAGRGLRRRLMCFGCPIAS